MREASYSASSRQSEYDPAAYRRLFVDGHPPDGLDYHPASTARDLKVRNSLGLAPTKYVTERLMIRRATARRAPVRSSASGKPKDGWARPSYGYAPWLAPAELLDRAAERSTAASPRHRHIRGVAPRLPWFSTELKARTTAQRL